MSPPASDQPLHALLEIVERDRDERRRVVAEEADARAREIVGEARRAARRKVGAAIADARRRGRARIESARASLETASRTRRNEASRKLLDATWPALPSALREAWDDDDARARWLDAAIDVAARMLPLGTWTIAHPDDLDAGEAARVSARVREITGTEPELSPDADVHAGARVSVGSACLDATIRGLLADRRSIEGRLLAEMWKEQP